MDNMFFDINMEKLPKHIAIIMEDGLKRDFYLEQQDIKLVWKLLELLLQNVKD